MCAMSIHRMLITINVKNTENTLKVSIVPKKTIIRTVENDFSKEKRTKKEKTKIPVLLSYTIASDGT